jgi:hypothetical protein
MKDMSETQPKLKKLAMMAMIKNAKAKRNISLPPEHWTLTGSRRLPSDDAHRPLPVPATGFAEDALVGE